MNLHEVLEKTKKVTPVAENNGIKVVTFEEQRDLAQAALIENTTLDLVDYNDDGTVRRTPTRFAAVNLDHYYINRYKKVRDRLYIVTDYRAITEQANGVIYAKQIPAYVIKRDENKQLQLEKMVTVSDDEFVADYTHTLNREAMKQVMPLLAAGVGVQADDISI